MSYETDAARRYRAHAEELRTMADYDKVEENRRKLLSVAKDYDGMAEVMEALEASHEMLRRTTSAAR